MIPLPKELYKILVGPLFGCIALACYFGCVFEVDTNSPLEGNRLQTSVHILLDWTYLILALLLGLVVLLTQMVGQFQDNAFTGAFSLLSLTTPAVPTIFHIVRSLNATSACNCSDCFMVALSTQLVISSFTISCLFGKNDSGSQQNSMDIATNAFSYVAVGILAFSLNFSSRLFIALGYAMQVLILVRYHTHSRVLPTHTSVGYISGVLLFGLSLFSQSVGFVMPLLSIGILAPLLGIGWDVVTMQRSLVGELTSLKKDSQHWQAVANTLKEASTSYESTLSAKSSFILGLANQVRVVSQGTGALVNILSDTDVQPNQSIYLSKLEKTIERLSDLVGDAQLYYEIELQSASIEAVFFRLDQLLEEVLSFVPLCNHIEEHDVDVAYLVEPSVPLNLMGDQMRLKVLLLRLLANAIKYTDQGEILIIVKLEKEPMNVTLPTPASSSSAHGGETTVLSISVEDTGSGITTDLEHIFDPFPINNRGLEEKDIGLGLSICKQLARLFGATLSVKSEIAKGTSFTLLCPFRIFNPLSASTSPWGMIGATDLFGNSWAQGKRVLVIDDNSNIGAVFHMHLDSTGCEFQDTNPTEAIQELKRQVANLQTFDAILIDYKIPGHNGEEVAKSIRNEPSLKPIPIVLLCTPKQRKHISLSNVHFLYKPIKKDRLLTVIHSLCTNKLPEKPELPAAGDIATSQERSTSPLRVDNIRIQPSPRKLSTIPEVENSTRSSLSSSSILPSPTANSPIVPHLRSSSFSAASLPSPRQPEPPVPQGNAAFPPENGQLRESTTEAPPRGASAPVTPRSSAPSSPTPQHPLTASEGAHSAPASTSSTPTPTSVPVPVPTSRKETILLVEDNPINAKIASAVLRRHSFEVELASNGQVALERVKKNHDHFQLILMDIHMPVMDGLTCAYLVRQFEKENSLKTIPIIALTADTTPGHRASCLEAGCNEFMSKPLDYPLLIEILKRLNPG